MFMRWLGFVGYDDTLKSIIVGHQGTNPTQLFVQLDIVIAYQRC